MINNLLLQENNSFEMKGMFADVFASLQVGNECFKASLFITNNFPFITAGNYEFHLHLNESL